MTLRAPASRLLPATIVSLALLLTVKSTDLVLAAIPGRGVLAAGVTLPVLRASAPATTGAPGAGAGAGALPAANALPPPQAGAEAAHRPLPPTASAAPPSGSPTAPAAAAAFGPANSGQATPPSDAAPIAEAERKVLLELRQRREELDKRDAALAARELVLAAAEHKLLGRVDELQALQKRLEALDASRRDREEAGWQGLVKTYEAMKPREAAAIFNDLDMPVLLQVVDRMKESKAAPVLAAMRVDKARELTDQLAQMRTKRTAAGGGS